MDPEKYNKVEMNDEIVCYCSELKKSEIYHAVNNGCCSINEVRLYTNKTTTGNCEVMNPKGICCHKEFQSIIDLTINLKNKQNDKK
jgi:bacterioferritin-associated ferredoxin